MYLYKSIKSYKMQGKNKRKTEDEKKRSGKKERDLAFSFQASFFSSFFLFANCTRKTKILKRNSLSFSSSYLNIFSDFSLYSLSSKKK